MEIDVDLPAVFKVNPISPLIHQRIQEFLHCVLRTLKMKVENPGFEGKNIYLL